FLDARHCDLGAVTEADVLAYVACLQGEGKAPASVARASVAVRSLHRFLADEGLADHDPTVAVETPKLPSGLPKALTEDEAVSLPDAVIGDEPLIRRDRAVLEVLYGTGIRISELVGLSLADLDLDGALMRVFGKGSKERVVPVGRPARRALEAWLD